MNITLKMIFCPQFIQSLIQKLHGNIRTDHNSGTQKQSLDIIAPIKSDGQITDLLRSKGSPRNVIAPAVDAVFAVIDAFVGHQDFQKRNTASIRTEAVTDAGFDAVANPLPVIPAVYTAGCTCHIIFCRIGKNL